MTDNLGKAPDTEVTPEPAAQPAAAAPAPTPQSSSPTPPATQVSHTSQSPSFTEVMTVLEAMPEKLVNAIREATQPAKAPKPAPESRSSAAAHPESGTVAESGRAAAPGKKSFGERWFGV